MKKSLAPFARDALSFKERAEGFIALGRKLEGMPQCPERDRLLDDAKRTIELSRQVLAKADDVRNWAKRTFGEDTELHPLADFLSRSMWQTLAMTMGQQAYRMELYLRGRPMRPVAGAASQMVVSALTQLGRIL